MIGTKTLGNVTMGLAAPFISAADVSVAAAVVFGAGLSVLYLPPASRIEGATTVATGLLCGWYLNGVGVLLAPPLPSPEIGRHAVAILLGIFAGALMRGLAVLAGAWQRNPAGALTALLDFWRQITGRGGGA